MKIKLMAPLALACGIALAQAQTVYRCGDHYGSRPCAGGKAITPEAAVPHPDERRQASAAAQRDARLADELQKERLKQESRPAASYIPPPAAEPVHEPHKWPEKAATRKLDVFTASGPAPATAKEKGARGGKSKTGKSKAGKPTAKAGKPKAKDGATGAKADAPAKDARKAASGRLAAGANR